VEVWTVDKLFGLFTRPVPLYGRTLEICPFTVLTVEFPGVSSADA
jgi:hypothetical protein